MALSNAGNEGSTTMTGGASDADKSLRRKKSLPRLFILSRKKSTKSTKSRPSSPTRGTEIAEPMPPTPTASKASTITLKSSPTPSSKPGSPKYKNGGQSSGSPAGIREYSPRDMTGTGRSMSTDSPLRRRQHDEDGKSGMDVGSIDHQMAKQSSPSWPLPTPRSQSPNLDTQPTFDAVPQIRDNFKHRQQQALLSAGSIPPRPHTAASARFPDDDSQQFPMHVGSARKANEENRLPKRSPVPEQWVEWRTSYTKEDLRESIRSGLSTGSSQPDSGSTGHSSTFTKMSSISDTTTYVDLDEYNLPKHASMTVDDAIDLYSAGFDDDEFDLPDGDPMKSPSDEETRRRSVKIAEAMNDTIDSIMMMPPPLISPETRDSAAIISGDAFKSIFPRPPPLRRPTSTHDQYGFRKWSRDITVTQYDAWYADYADVQERRCQKWAAFMQAQNLPTKEPTRFPDRSVKAQRFVRKGIPPAWRGDAWFYYAGGDKFLRKQPDLYAQLVLQSQTPKLSTNDKESIERDLHRTFPDNIHFKPDQPTTPTTETALLSSLRRVLCAFAVHHPQTGYCQSLNFIAGLLLLFLPEEKAFWMLHIITTYYLPGTHEISLEGANVDLWVLMLALKEAVPNIWAKVGGEVNASTTRLPPISLCTTSWFMSLFIGTLPIESVLRVWDVLFYEGSRTMFRIALAIFKLGENEIKSVSDPMETFQVVQCLPRKMLGISALMAVACRRGGVSQAWVEKKRRERKDWYAKERAVEKIRKDSRDVGRRESAARKASKDDSNLAVMPEDDSPAEEFPVRSRTNTGWRGRIGFGRG